MKKVFVISGLFVLYFTTVLMADKTGVAAERNQDRTGSPVATSSTQQCDKCHSGGNFNTAIQLKLKDSNGNIVTEYIGGETYTYEVEVTGSGSRFGFQSVALLQGNGNAGTMTASSSNSKITMLNNRRYAEHTGASTTGLFVMNWVAPAPGSGTVSFYASGNSVNNNNASSGDDPVLASPMIITESAFSNVSEENKLEEVLIYPNPSESFLNFITNQPRQFKIQIYDVTGKFVFEKELNDSSFTLDVSDWEKGLYLIVFSGEINGTKNFIR